MKIDVEATTINVDSYEIIELLQKEIYLETVFDMWPDETEKQMLVEQIISTAKEEEQDE